jgi:hypothetical protein
MTPVIEGCMKPPAKRRNQSRAQTALKSLINGIGAPVATVRHPTTQVNFKDFGSLNPWKHVLEMIPPVLTPNTGPVMLIMEKVE